MSMEMGDRIYIRGRRKIMRRVFLFVLAGTLIMSVVLLAGEAEIEKDRTEIRNVIESAYIKGVHTDWDAEAARNGFHPEFEMLIYEDGGIRKFPIGDWVKSIERNKKNHPEGPQYEITHEIPMVDVTGNAAVVRIEVYRDGKHIYTDYMSLYKFEEGWKIVSKIYYSHK
jgi:hypothetical protein